MGYKKNIFEPLLKLRLWLPPVILALLLIVISQFEFLNVHVMAVRFAVMISFVTFAFVWMTHDYRKNNFLLFLACGYFWIGSLDIVHILVYERMDLFIEANANLSVQLWISARYSEALLLLAAPFAATRKRNGYFLLTTFGIVAVGLVTLIFSRQFSTVFSEGKSLTDFNVYGDYLIILILAFAVFTLIRHPSNISKDEKVLISASITFTMFAELFFSSYVSFDGHSNLVGHILKTFAYWFIFQAIVIYNLKKPFSEMLELQEYSRGLFDSSVTGMALCKMDGTFVDVNPAFARLTEYSVEELLKLDYWHITPEKYSSQEEDILDNANTTGKYGPVVKEYIRKDGSLISVELTGMVLLHNGEPHMWSSVEDITERQKLQKTTIELEFQKQTLDEHAIVSMSDANRNIIYVNDKFCTVSGYSREELLGKKHAVLRTDEQTSEFYDNLWRTVSSGKVWQGEMKNRKKDGGYFWVDATIVPFQDEKGEVAKYVTVRTDITERVNAERANHEFKATLDVSNDAIHMFWPDTLEYFYVNQTALDMADLKEEEFVGSTPAQFNSNFDEEVFRKRSAPLVLGKEKSVIYELDYVNRNGTQFSLEIFLQYVTPPNGNPRFVSVARDITERREAERAILRFKTTVDLTQDAIFMISIDTFDIFFANKAASNYIGYTKEELCKMHVGDFNPDFSISEFRKKHRLLLEGSVKSIVFQTDHYHKDGTAIPVEVNLQRIEPDEGKAHLISVVRDITERKAADLQISQFKSTLDSIQDPVYMFWPDTLEYFYVNQAAVDFSGISEEDYLGHTPMETFAHFELQEFHERYAALYSGELVAQTYEIEHFDNNGESVSVDVLAQIIHPKGEKAHFVEITRDITERKAVDKAKSEFISTISHELRTPLTSIKGSLGLIESGIFGKLPDKLLSMISIAHANSDRLALLIDDILDAEQISSRMMNFQMKPTSLNILIEEAIIANTGYADKYNVTLANSPDDPFLVVNVDRDRMMQVMANLLSNAVKFSPAGGKVDVSVSRNDEGIRTAVKDYGCGIPEEARATIFDRFTQADSSDQRSIGGTGLGLNIAKAIIEGHGGTIGFTSDIGKGTTFYFDLEELTDESAT